MNAAKPLLEIRELAKRYGSFQALSGISFDMFEGEIISVLGPSGCGKSTLLQLVAGLAQPDGGEIKLGGATIASQQRMVPPEKRDVNMVFQDYALWPHMSVLDNISYGLKQRKSDRKGTADHVAELMGMLHLDGMEKRLPPQLSGGQQQRVAIARALATRPRLMLLDEPLSNLDMRLRIEMRTEMAYLFRQLGMSVFHVTHDPEEAFAMADRLLIMRGGRVDQIGTPQECYTRPASRWAASLLGAINHISGELVLAASGYAIRTGSALLAGTADTACRADRHGASRAEMLFRPEDVTITGPLSPSEEQAFDEGKQPDAWHNKFKVKVKYCTFEGKHWRCNVEMTDGTGLFVLSEKPFEPNAVLSAHLPKEFAYLYPVEKESHDA